jgi:hypothetical protein
VAYHEERRIAHLWGICHYTVVVRRCQNQACGRHQVSIRPEGEGALALPHGGFGLDVIALVGQWRFVERRSMRQIHQNLCARRVRLAPRTVTNLAHGYQALLAPPLAGSALLSDRLRWQERVVLAIDGVQPGQGQPVLWVLRDVLSGSALLARSLPEEQAADLASLVAEVAAALPVTVVAVLSDGQRAIRDAVQSALPYVSHYFSQSQVLVEVKRHATQG